MKQFCTYIMTNPCQSVLYIGVTSDLTKRAYEHKYHVIDGFTKKYNCKHLVYYELHDTAEHAIKREKRLKEWQRQWKIELIESLNPDWRDLYDTLL